MATNESNIVPTKFRINPQRIIVGIVKCPDENTMALGGVATGSMNAHEAASATGTVNNNGEISALNDSAEMAMTSGILC